MSKLQLLVFEKNTEIDRFKTERDDDITIGRAGENHIRLSNGHVSSRHAMISKENDVWTIHDLGSTNGLKVNGKKVTAQGLNSSDTISIYPYTIKVTISTREKPAYEDITIATAGITRDEGDATVMNNFGLADETRLDRPAVAQPKTSVFKLVRIAALILLLIGMASLLAFQLFGPTHGKQEPTPSVQGKPQPLQKEKPPALIPDLSSRREHKSLLDQAASLIRQGQYSEALNRLSAAVAILPEDEQTLALITDVKGKIHRQEEEKAQEAARLAALRQKLEQGITLAEKRLRAGRFQSARQIIKTLPAEGKNYSQLTSLTDRADKLAQRINLTIARQQKKQAAAKTKKAKKQQQVIDYYENGLRAYQGGDYETAIRQWELAAASKIDIPEPAKARNSLRELRVFLNKAAQPNFSKGMTCYQKADYSCALQQFNMVLEIYPEHRKAADLVADILPKQEEKAKRLYQDGLVYEGINNIEAAIEKWQQALVEMPLATNEYRVKTLRKLRVHGAR